MLLFLIASYLISSTHFYDTSTFLIVHSLGESTSNINYNILNINGYRSKIKMSKVSLPNVILEISVRYLCIFHLQGMRKRLALWKAHFENENRKIRAYFILFKCSSGHFFHRYHYLRIVSDTENSIKDILWKKKEECRV